MDNELDDELNDGPCTPDPRAINRGAVNRRGLIAAGASVPAVALLGDARHAMALPAARRRKRRDHRVLLFTRTTSFRHASIPVAIETFTELANSRGIEVEATEDPRAFRGKNLRRFTAVAFVNTTGDVLGPRQRKSLRRFVLAGGGWIGVHSAADSEYSNSFYSRLLSGGRFLAHPVQQPGIVRRENTTHRSTRHLPDQWVIPFEEFYSFTRSVRGRAKILLNIDESSYLQDPNTSNLPTGPENPFPSEGVTGVMGDHPMSWQRQVGRGLSWYTALGHEIGMYSDPLFRDHLLGGIVTASVHGRRKLKR